jgi:hypothetical protein
MIFTHTHTAASEKAWKVAQRNLRNFREAAAAAAATLPDDSAEAAEAAAIAAALVDGGKIVAGRIPAAPVRHTTGIGRNLRTVIEEIHGENPGNLCPLLVAEGITSVDVNNAKRRNGRSDVEVRTVEAPHRCPVCLAGEVVRKIRVNATGDVDARWWGR